MLAHSHRNLLVAALVFVVVLATAAASWLSLGGGPVGGELRIGGPFALQDANGRPFTDRDLRGHYTLVYFGYTFCPDVCPTTLTAVTTAMAKLGPRAERVLPVFITVDPERDTPAVLREYISMFTPRLVGLTGTPEQIAAVAREYRVYYRKHAGSQGEGGYSVDHSSLLYLLDSDGRFIAPIPADESGEGIAAAIGRYL